MWLIVEVIIKFSSLIKLTQAVLNSTVLILLFFDLSLLV